MVVVDGDPGTGALRETMARLAGAGAAAGIHLVCLAETTPASALSPLAATYEAACDASPAFRECGAVGLLSGDVATALRVMRAAAAARRARHGGRRGRGVRCVGGALRPRPRAAARAGPGGAGPGGFGAAAVSRLLDELELARATPASLMARWASAPDGTAVLGAARTARSGWT